VLLAIFGFGLMAWLTVKRIHGALMIGIISVTLLSIVFGVTPLPTKFAGWPSSLSPILGQLDIAGALSPKAWPVVLIVFVMAFVDTIGTLIGLSARAGLLDEKGNLPDIERPMLADALSNLVAPVLGTTTTGAYIESAAGIEEGGKTGFTAVIVSALFLLSLFLSPLLTVVPPHAYGPVLIIIGSFMIKPIARIDFDDYTELIPAFLTITLISFTYNIGVGMTAGLLTYPLLKAVSGRSKEVPPALWVLAGLSLLFYISYPYH
jgi:AGZA family xanthine/uracil permease-like MFS transporter